jgi:pimeloyl-ACP methyl ester carboxylesterase
LILKKIVLVGYSFGSVLSNAILATSLSLVDGAVLTGIGYDTLDTSIAFEAWQLRLASVQSLARWRQLDGGYITWVDIYANVNTYVKSVLLIEVANQYTSKEFSKLLSMTPKLSSTQRRTNSRSR